MGNILLIKSNDNFEVAQFLHSEQYFCSSVHCAYYSSYQLILFVIDEYLDFEDKDFSSKDLNDAGSHNICINTIKNKIRKIDRDLFYQFSANIRELKEFRKNADYKKTVILIGDSKKAISQSAKINMIIKKLFLS
jgi:acetylglutamate synthase